MTTPISGASIPNPDTFVATINRPSPRCHRPIIAPFDWEYAGYYLPIVEACLWDKPYNEQVIDEKQTLALLEFFQGEELDATYSTVLKTLSSTTNDQTIESIGYEPTTAFEL
jgi:hypothetical protein